MLKLWRIAAALVIIAMVAPAASGQEITTLTLQSGHSLILPASGLSRVAVGDGRIAGVVPIGRSELVVNGKAPGQTTLFVWRDGRRYTYGVTVSEQSVDTIAAMLRSTISNPAVEVVSFGRSVILRGQIQTPQEMARYNDVLSRFEPDAKANKYSLINALTVMRPLGTMQDDLAAIPGGAAARIDRDEKGNLVVSGRVPDRMTAERLLDRVRASGTALPPDAKVIDRLGIDSVSQIDIKVYVLEVDNTALDQLGIRLQSGVPDVNHPGFYILNPPNFPALESPGSNGSGKPNSGPGGLGRLLNVGAFVRTTVLAPTLDLIRQNGHARLLSSPDLVTMPGRQATFLVGGEIPIPFASGPGQIAIQYKEFGVRLDVTPTILGDGSVETKIAPEVSDLDFADGITTGGFFIPALKTSKLSTNVVTHDGESIVMGGLLRRQEQRFVDKIPLLGDLPVLGKLFRSNRYQKSETDVVFVMVPQIITR